MTDRQLKQSLNRVGEWSALCLPPAEWLERHYGAVRKAEAAYQRAPEDDKWAAYYVTYTEAMNA